jgi:hypothetical protein
MHKRMIQVSGRTQFFSDAPPVTLEVAEDVTTAQVTLALASKYQLPVDNQNDWRVMADNCEVMSADVAIGQYSDAENKVSATLLPRGVVAGKRT